MQTNFTKKSTFALNKYYDPDHNNKYCGAVV